MSDAKPHWKHPNSISMEASPSSSDSVVNMAGPSGNLLSNSHSRQQLAEDEVIVAQALQICAVCKVDTNSSNLNYGAPTCLSCRAFFRRIIQQKLKQELKCRSGGKCVITLETRKKCKRCRFEACLKVGMKPDSVLDENQYQRRFRKMISKQQQHIMEKQQVRNVRYVYIFILSEESFFGNRPC